jgi:cystathionine beta-lyase/cystathionine gamma-synthase
MGRRVKKQEKSRNEYARETFLIHGNPRDEQWQYTHHVIPPITASTAFRLDSTDRGGEGFRTINSPEATEPGQKPIYIYDRMGEPTVALLENAFKGLEGGPSACAFGSGMAAISTTLLALCNSGHEIAAHRVLYGCTFSLMTNALPRFGVTTRFGDLTDLANLPRLVTDRTRVIFFESPANPTMDIIDIRAVADAAAAINAGRAEENRVVVVVDNTFATPYCQRPLSLGADIVVHSLTKNVMGFGTDMGGMQVGPLKFHQPIRLVRKDFGGVVSPRAAWNVLVYGLSSLAIRTEKQMANARTLAAYLENRKEVQRVVYPGLKSHSGHAVAKKQMLDFKGRFAPGILLYFEVKGKEEKAAARARNLMDWLAQHAYAVTLAVSLGQAKTLIQAPALMTHSAYGAKASTSGISLGGIRLSLGIEEAADIIADLDAAFRHIND